MDSIIDSVRAKIAKSNLEAELNHPSTSNERRNAIKSQIYTTEETIQKKEYADSVATSMSSMSCFLDDMTNALEHREWRRLDKELQYKKLFEFLNENKEFDQDLVLDKFESGKMKGKQITYNKILAKIEAIAI